MAHDNIKLSKDHFVVRDGYFYYINESNNVMYQKGSDGATIFTYPIIDIIGVNPVKCMEYDGHYFWTMQAGATNEDLIIKKFYEKNFAIHLEEKIDLTNNPDHSFNADTFSLEYYNTTLSGTVLKDATTLELVDYTVNVRPGTLLTLGPNKDGLYEDVTVTGTLYNSNTLGLDFFVKYDYDGDTPVNFSTNIWLLNKYAYKVLDDGALYQITLPKKEIGSIVVDSDFATITASCFYSTTTNRYILIVLGTNLRFLNLTTLEVDKTMNLDNIKIDQATIITITALQLDGDSIFRLQRSATYFGIDNNYSSSNYQIAPFRPFVDSVSVDVLPKILPCNGINIADVLAVVKDQYSHPMKFKPVMFQDSDTVGYMTITNTHTDLFGSAKSYYRAGIVPNNVTIMVLATQYD